VGTLLKVNAVNSVEPQNGQYRAKTKFLTDSDKNLIRSYKDRLEYTITDVASIVGCQRRTVAKYIGRQPNDRSTWKKLRKGSFSNRYVGVRIENGYKVVLRPDWWKGTAKYVPVHHLVWGKWNGAASVPKGFVVHHKDENKLNNHFTNLELMSRAEHCVHHKPRKGTGKV